MTLTDEAAERALCGALMLDGERARAALPPGAVEACATPANRLVLSRALELLARGQHPDTMSLRNRLAETGELAAIGGDAYLADLACAGSGLPSLPSSARRVLDLARRRRVQDALGRIAEWVGAPCDPETFDDVLRVTLTPLLDPPDPRRDAGGLVAVSAPDLLGAAIPPRPAQLGPWLRQGDLGMLFAPRGAGKTWFTLTLAVAVAAGVPAWGWDTPAPVPVAYIDGEMSLPDLQTRLAQIVRALGVQAPERLQIVPYEANLERGLTIATPDGQTDMDRLIDTQGARLVVFDNLSCLLGGVAENDADAWEVVRGFLLRLRARGVSVMMIHHEGKTAGTARGTSRREDALDWVIRLAPEGDDDAPGARFSVEFTKHRGGMTPSPFVAGIADNQAGGITLLPPKPATLQARVMAAIEAGVGKQSEIAEMLGVTRGAVCKILHRLERSGAVQRNNSSWEIA